MTDRRLRCLLPVLAVNLWNRTTTNSNQESSGSTITVLITSLRTEAAIIRQHFSSRIKKESTEMRRLGSIRRRKDGPLDGAVLAGLIVSERTFISPPGGL